MKQPTEKLNLRLPADLKAQLQAYADETGISLNAACVLAIRNFLPFAVRQAEAFDRAVKPKAKAAKVSPQQVTRQVEENPLYRKVGRNELCPCFSGKKAKHCHPEWT